MPLLNESRVRARALRGVPTNFSAANVLSEHVKKLSAATQHDIFLSHAFDDKNLILGVVLSLEDRGYSVYLDWRDDPDLDRNSVTPATAEKLRARMRLSRCLFYAVTDSSRDSKWMPWELGFKDGHNTRTAILPVTQSADSDSFAGQQYLGIYPYVADGQIKNKDYLWIHRSEKNYVLFDKWLGDEEPSPHP